MSQDLHRWARARLLAWRAGLLTSDEAERLASHVRDCDPCRALADAFEIPDTSELGAHLAPSLLAEWPRARGSLEGLDLTGLRVVRVDDTGAPGDPYEDLLASGDPSGPPSGAPEDEELDDEERHHLRRILSPARGEGLGTSDSIKEPGGASSPRRRRAAPSRRQCIRD